MSDAMTSFADYLDWNGLMTKTNLSRSTLKAHLNGDTGTPLPKPFYVGSHPLWIPSEIDGWLADRARAYQQGKPTGRPPKGQELSPEQIKEIRSRAAHEFHTKLAREFSISPARISRIVNGV